MLPISLLFFIQYRLSLANSSDTELRNEMKRIETSCHVARFLPLDKIVCAMGEGAVFLHVYFAPVVVTSQRYRPW
jgi:hypothetical protein